ncbi:MAG TPA: sensor domain-containing diguanylate cyclase [Burkholderiaceae bacterium]|jgi:diguanylate cyclase (GGDEF)-like protein
MRAGLMSWLRRYGVPAFVLLVTLAFTAASTGNWTAPQTAAEMRELVSWAGIVVGIMLALLAYLLGTARERAQVLAERMTRALRESEQRWAFALEGTGDGLWDWQILPGTITTSERAKIIMSWHGDVGTEPTIRQLQSRMHPEDRVRAVSELQRCLDGHCAHFVAEFRVQDSSGSQDWNWVLARGTVVERDRRQRPLRMIGTVSDINVRRRSEERVRFMALHDPLTELANRAHFDERMHFALANARRYGETIGLILLDLDRFKAINDIYGHAIGDQLLQTVARRLKASVRETDTAGRIGGDEFVVLLTGPVTRETARLVSEKIYAQIAQPMDLGGLRIEITCSLGLALYPEDGTDEKMLAKAADDAMYRNKRAGRQLFGESRYSGL